jgi:phage terminase large subunit GpA-like protein
VIKAGLQIWHLDTDYFKTWLYSRFEWPEDQPGGFHLASDTTDEYCMQMTAEAKVAKPSGQTTWVRLRKDNHYLDAEALNVAAAHILQVHLLRDTPPEPKEPKAAESSTPQRNYTTEW